MSNPKYCSNFLDCNVISVTPYTDLLKRVFYLVLLALSLK